MNSKTKKITLKISKLEQNLRKGYSDLIKACFVENPSIKSVNLTTSEQYDDNNYYTQIKINGLNNKPIPDYEISSQYDLDDAGDSFKSFLFENKIKDISVTEFVEILLEQLPKEYLLSLFDGEELLLKRDDYVKKTRKSRKTDNQS